MIHQKTRIKNYLIILFTILQNTLCYGQVTNDDCFNATDLGVLTIGSINSLGCFDASYGYDTVVFASNVNAIPNYPYYATIGCLGSTVTPTPANDIWYKIKSGNFKIGVSPSNIDSILLNVWVGSDCNNLTTRCCHVFINADFNSYFFSFLGATNTSDYVYLQFSGTTINKVGAFSFCLKDAPIIPICYSTPYIITDVKEKNEPKHLPFFVFSNDNQMLELKNSNDILSLKISDLNGKNVFEIKDITNTKIFDLSLLKNGLYVLTMTSSKEVYNQKLLIVN